MTWCAHRRLARMRPNRVQPGLRMPVDDALDMAEHKGMGHADGQADVDLEPAMAWQHIDLDAALDDADRDRDLVEDRRGASADSGVDRAESGLDCAADRIILLDRQALEFVQVADQLGGNADRVRTRMSVGGVCAWRVDLDDDAQCALLPEADHARHARLTVQHAIAPELLAEVFDQPFGAPGAPRFLVGDAGQGQATGKAMT